MTVITKEKEVGSEKEIAWASFLFTAVGVGYLFPFSALTQPVDYWNLIFPDFNIEFPLTTLYMWVNLIFLFLIVFFGGTPSYTFRIVGGFTGQLIVLICVPSFYFLGMDEYTHYTMVMVATAMAAIATAFIDSVAISFASQFPVQVQVALQFGIGFSTLIGSVYRIVTKLVFPVDQVVASSLLYFYSGAATILLCIYAYYCLLSLPLTKRCVSFGVQEEQAGVEDAQPLMSLEANTASAKASTHTATNYGATNSTGISIHTEIDAESQQTAPTTPLRPPTPSTPITTEVDKWAVLYRVGFNEFVVFSIFFSTLLLWPPLITEIPSYNFPQLQATHWWPLILLAVFSLSDCMGRLCVPYRGWLTSGNIWVASLLRLGLFPLLICSAKGLYFTHDLFSIAFVYALGFTNGYLGSLSIIFVNEMVTEAETGIVGMFSGFFLNLGLVFGATAACFVEALVLGH